VTIKYQTIQEIVYAQIRSQILSGELKPGQTINQKDLASAMGVSRMPIREALLKLDAEGLITVYPHRGAVVSAITLEEFNEIYRIREELELLAVEWIGNNLSAVELPKLTEAFSRLREADMQGDVPKRMDAVREFHFLILDLCGRTHLLGIIRSLWDLTEQYRRIYSALEGVSEQRLQVYSDIVRACELGDHQALQQAYHLQYKMVRDLLIPYLQTHEGQVALTELEGTQE
jgi:DNA-binding GntR family transcriptional regulator